MTSPLPACPSMVSVVHSSVVRTTFMSRRWHSLLILLLTFLFIIVPAVFRLSLGRVPRIQCINCLVLHNWVNVTLATGSFMVLSRRSGS